jgi:hypothetical protein
MGCEDREKAHDAQSDAALLRKLNSSQLAPGPQTSIGYRPGWI